jgi:ADP-ribose pyrophosphatase YjhB (NUDIX family)
MLLHARAQRRKLVFMSDLPELRGPSVRQIPEGDNNLRLVCPDCGYIAYENPKVIVGAVCYDGDKILLCKRAIEPRKGFWTLPAGFLELRETVMQGAQRETFEEARADVEIEALLAVYTIPRIGHVQLIYRARLLSPEISPGPESEEVALFVWEDIPWDQIAFPSVHWALHHHREVMGETGTTGVFAPRSNPPGEFGNY